MKRTASAVITVLVFLVAILAWATFQARGNPFTHPGFAWMLEHNRPVSATFAALSLAGVALAGWIAAALAGGQARRAMLLGWLAALPTLIAVVAVVLEVTGLADRMLGDPLEDPDTYHRLPARIINFTRLPVLALGLYLPFSAGVVIFGLVYPIAMVARWGWRRLQGRRAPV